VRRIKLDKSILFLVIIIAVAAAVAVSAFLFLKTDEVKSALENDQILKMLFIVEDGGKPLSTFAFFYYPPTKRAALFDIPAETGLIIPSLKKVAGVGILFKPSNPAPYRDEVSRLLSTEIPLYFVLPVDGLAEIVDLIDGVELFIPNPVETEIDGRKALFPQGSRLFDGDKLRDYFRYEDPDETEGEPTARRQKAFISLLKRLSERSDYVSDDAVLGQFRSRIRTNASEAAMKRLFRSLDGLDAERIVPSRVQGAVREVEGEKLLFPHYDGELLKDIVRQNLNALANAGGTGGGERIFTLEILNGTAIKGLAKRAASLYESFGYEVLRYGNAEAEDTEKTALVDRFGDEAAAKDVAQVIRCGIISKPGPGDAAPEGGADFVILIGKDFNGRYCVE